MNSAQVAGGRNLAQKALVVGEVATSLVLLMAAALLLTSFWKLVHTSPGFSTENIVTFKTSFSDEQTATSAALGQRLNELVTQLEAQPGVESAAAVDSLPTQLHPDLPFDIPGRPAGQPNSWGNGKYMPITAHYFDAMRIPLISGRSFNLSDTNGSESVVIVNQQIARKYFKGQNPVGERIRIGAGMGPGLEDGVREIIGVVGDTKQTGLDAPVPEILYIPPAQVPDKITQMISHLLATSWVARTRTAQVDVMTAARRIFMDNARTPLLSVEPMQEVISKSVAQQRFLMLLLSVFGLVSLVLGGAGLYGVMSYTVARQTKEIGVRMAIGAQRGDILRLVLREAIWLVGIGLVIGLAATLAVTQLLQSLLFGVAPRDPLTLVIACTILSLVGLFAAWWPAKRAASIDPMQALRME